MNFTVKLVLFPAIAICALIYVLYFIGGGTTGRQADAFAGFIIGGAGLAACAYTVLKVYFGSGLVRAQWLALAAALGPLVVLLARELRLV